MNTTAISIQNISKFFPVGKQKVQILNNIAFDIQDKDFLVIFGPSGCGKSTLLHSILGLEVPSSGTVTVLGKNFYAPNLSEDDRSEIRHSHFGMIYQQPNWITSQRVIDNVAFPLTLSGANVSVRKEKAREMLKLVNMLDWQDYFASELSSGQQQLVSVARAMITDPQIIVADEPTGNLDYESGSLLMDLLDRLNKDQGKTIIMVTHDLEYLKYSNRAVRLLDGQVVDIYEPGDKNKLFSEIKSKRQYEIHNT